MIEVAAQAVRLRAEWTSLTRLPAGMVEALVAAELVRPERGELLRGHYGTAMPALRSWQIEGREGAQQRVFGSPLRLRRMPRLRAALEALFALVAEAGLAGRDCLGAATPLDLVEGRTLAEVYAGCHFGGSMPMLYAYPANLADALESDPLEVIDARLVGPLLHELSHFHAQDPPAPANVHEGLAAFIGSEAWPAQVCPEPGGEDAIPGAAYFAALGGWIARAIGWREALRVQAGALDLRQALGPPCAAALRLYGFLPFLQSGAPHLLSDAFHPGRWWKLIDLHRDDDLAREFHGRLVEPLLSGAPAREEDWNAALDALPWPGLPAWRDAPGPLDGKLAALAENALRVRVVRRGGTFIACRADPAPAPTLDRPACELRADWPGPDDLGAPPAFPWPPALCSGPAKG
ncbi:MAG TPA: hypothetical protein VMK66_13435 [Myxococcales bacterium]|nr:hypothetical protein [Myxococcales bacterium]